MTQVRFQGFDCTVQKHAYANGRIALRLVDEEGPVATCTVNLPDQPASPDTVFIKDHSENHGLLDALVKARVVRPTGYTVRSGHVDVPVCELLPPFREPTHAEGVERSRGGGRSR